MNCWICSRQWKFGFAVLQFVTCQKQWPRLRYRVFQGNVQRMAEDLCAAITRPDVIIVDQRDGWDIAAGIQLCRALLRRQCNAPIIYLDLSMSKGVVVKYLVEVHDTDQFCDIEVLSVEMANEKWEFRLLDAIEEALEEPLAIARSRGTALENNPVFSDN